jgi:replication factor C subunit 2/4
MLTHNESMQEAHSRVTRFILICNYVTRIIEPLASRCAKFRFQPLPPDSMKARLTFIAQAEGCAVEEKELDFILELCEGDMRRAVTTLQSAHALGGPVDSDALAEMAGLPPTSVMDTLWSELSKDSFSAMQTAVEDVCAGGYSAQVILVALSRRVITSTELNELSKANISIRIAEAEKNLVDKADEYLQLMTVCSLIMTCMEESKTSKR